VDNQRINHLILLCGHMVSRIDMKLIGKLVRRRDPGMRVSVAKLSANPWTWLRSLGRQSCVVSMTPIKRRAMLRGRVYEGERIDKAAELRVLDDIGLPVPDWVLITPDDDKPEVAHLGKYVVTKPVVGRQGADVKIKRAGRVRYAPPRTDVAREAAERHNNPNIIAQRFIYTGPYPVNHRVSTCFGKMTYTLRQEASRDRTPLAGPEAIAESGGVSIVSSGKGCRYTVCDDPEVIELGERVHREAFPHVPSLGIDIVREQPTGKLYVIECNPAGFSWNIHARNGFKVRGHDDLDLFASFDPYRVAADAILERLQRPDARRSTH